MGVAQLPQKGWRRLLALPAVLTYVLGVPLSSTKCSAGAGMLTRNAVPESVWQSVQWQMLSASGSTSAWKVISPQWQCPSIFMRLVPKWIVRGAIVDEAKARILAALALDDGS